MANMPPGKAGLQHLQEALRLGLAVVTEIWAYPTTDWVTSVHAADIDGDGDFEVLVGSRDGTISALTRKGQLKWQQTESTCSWIGAVYCLNAANAVDRTRIVVGSRNNKVTALDESGQLLWQYTTDRVVRRIRVSDIDQDGKLEVVVGSEDCIAHVLACETGTLLWQFETDGWVRSVYSIDLDGDGKVETLIASGDKHLYVVDGQGHQDGQYEGMGKIHALCAADLDGDGQVEILIGSDAKDLYAMTLDGKKKWQFTPKNRIHSINIVDLNNDGRLEVIAGSEDEHIYFLDDQGNLLWKHYMGHRIFSINSIDLNCDGLWEVLVGAEDNNVHVLRVELSGGLLTKIMQCHTSLGSPHSSSLNLSPTERALLRDLTDESMPHERGLSLPRIEQLMREGLYQTALSELLSLDQQRVQLLWQHDVGHIRAASLRTVREQADMQIVVGTDEGEIKVLAMPGNLLWSYSFAERIRTVQTADIDRDGDYEVIVGGTDGRVYALDSSGQTLKWQTQFDDWIESICVNELPDSQSTEMVLCSADRKIHIYRGDLLPVIEPIEPPQSIQVVQTYDLDGDGVQEIIAGAVDDRVYAYARDGRQLWVYQTMDRVRSLCIKDIDNDGQVEILVCSEDRNLHVLDHTGHLKWRYYTPHRVLNVDAIDADHDGQVEVFVGVGNGRLYVLNGNGDLLWHFEANDRIRVVRAADMNHDGVVEVLVGTEDRLYLLQMLDRQQLQGQIERCWQALLDQGSAAEVLHDLAVQPDPTLRAFALKQLLASNGAVLRKRALLEKLLTDQSFDVKMEIAQLIVPLYILDPQVARTCLENLSMDRQRELRLALIESLPALCEHDPQVGFAYLDRLTRNMNKWIRRAVVRSLDQLVVSFPQQVFALLRSTIQDEASWIRQESARVLAHYFEVYTHDLLRGLRLLIVKDLDPPLLELMIYCTSEPQVKAVLRAFVGLLSNLTERNVLDRLRATVEVLEETRNLLSGESTYLVYAELYALHRIRTITKIAQYKCQLDLPDEDDETRFQDTLQVLHRLNAITALLRTYLRRNGLGDRISSLLEATTAIDKLYTYVTQRYFSWSTHPKAFPDCSLLRVLLVRWYEIVTTELASLRGKAELRPELKTRLVPHEDAVCVVLSITNVGRCPADCVTVLLKHAYTFEILGSEEQVFETIPTNEAISAEFTIKPYQNMLHLTFEIVYDDAEARGKVLPFGDRLELIKRKQEFKRMQNPYHTGTPVQDQGMFYGRAEELALLQEDFVHSTANSVVVLYGQRRSGKTSLLYQLLQTAVLDPHIPIHLDMQHETMDFSTSKFLHTLALHIFGAVSKRGIHVAFPQRAHFDENATFALDLFLDTVEAQLAGRKLVILIDEFEILEEKVLKKELDRDIFVFLRSLMQNRRGLHFLLAGTHEIKQLVAEYWSVFFNIASHRRLSKLSASAAVQLITQPVAGTLEYDPIAVEKIRQLTGDQPYLIQLICHSLVRHCNAHHKNYVTVNDVNVGLEDVMLTGSMYFTWIWEQASQDERVVLAIMAQEGGDEGHYLSLIDIERYYQDCGLPYQREQVLQALHNLRDGDVIAEATRENRFRIAVGLTRVWLHEAKPLQNVILEENLLS